MDPSNQSRPVTTDELRSLFLFEALDDAQLAWLVEHGAVEERAAGEVVYAEGQPATCFFVLIEGTLSMTRTVQGEEVETIRSNQRGVYAGATTAFVATTEGSTYPGSVHAVTACTFFVLDAESFRAAMLQWFPMAMHLIEGLYVGIQRSSTIVGERERLLSLGRLSAGLTHELNNPAAAAVRATSSLRERVAKMRHKLSALASGHVDPDVLMRLSTAQEDAIERKAKAPELSPVETADAEDALGDWMDDRGIGNGWDLAPILVAAGIDTDWLDRLADDLDEDILASGLGWIAYAVETEMLMDEIEDSTDRISNLVGAAKQYSQLDRAPFQQLLVHEGLKSTLVMLMHKIRAAHVEVVKDLAPDVPPIPGYPGELNQVWTNLVDNAIGAMPDGGTLTLRTRLDGGWVVVEVCDTGTGVPEELRSKIFEPFFTTKPTGSGTGLGLDISYRIVTQRHGGTISVRSEPGDTRFVVRLPLTEAPATTTA
jgi:signal transduction histidine kinase